MQEDNDTLRNDGKTTTARKKKGAHGGGHNLKGSPLECYKAKHPKSVVLRLVKDNRLGAWGTIADSHVVFARFSKVKELEEVLTELSGDLENKYHINTENRVLDGMSFRSDDCMRRTYYVIAIDEKFSFRSCIPILAHEAVHTAINILNDHRIALDADVGEGHNSESVSYLVGKLVELGLRTFWPKGAQPEELNPIEKMFAGSLKQGDKAE